MRPLVSITCVTYNQKDFIRDAIEGFLIQKTTFPYEILIHDDASSDGTAQIIKEYEFKYPELIFPIYQTENQYSKGTRRILSAFIFPKCKGEYIAICEGDDYWIDPLKLQKQYEAINKYDAVLVTHSSFVTFFQDGKFTSEVKIRRARDESGFLDFGEIITSKTQFHTSSIFLRSGILKKLPEWFYQAPVGDLPIKAITAQAGKIYYIDEIMSVYRKGISGSYTERKRTSILQEDGWRADHEKDFLQMYRNIDEYTNYQYADLIRGVIKGRLLNYFEIIGNLDYLPIVGLQKKNFRLVAVLARLLPPGIRRKVLRKIVIGNIEKYLKESENALGND